MPALAWLLLALPLLAAATIQLVLPRRGRLAGLLATASAGATLLLALVLLGAAAPAHGPSFAWATAGTLTVDFGLLLDELAVRMMVVVTGVGFLVHVFSLGYMADDDARGRYFAGLALFMFAMTGVVLADGLLMLFVFWELVGLSSYILIGHWYRRASAADAAKKAFLTNRIGDFGFMIGILLIGGITGHYDFAGIMAWAAATPPDPLHPLVNTALLCLFCGAVGKSAQFPLHVWLPDAMEGPTPVSALIHAATMVAAGVYLLVRLQATIGAEWFGGPAGTVIASIGALTALLAALVAIRQDDIKRVLAFSTLSQLGYMVLAVGCLAGPAAMFHLFTHAWFKALLFLAAGAVIHACHHQQDIWQLGGLARRMPVTTACFAAGALALVAVPGTSGFFSKEQILTAAWQSRPILFWVATAVAALTACYMGRLFLVAFLGPPRSDAATQAREVGPLMWLPLAALATLALLGGCAFVAGHAAPLYHHHPAATPVLAASLAALAAGAAAAWLLYARRRDDPLATRPAGRALARGLGIDAFYAAAIRWLQDGAATIVHFLDELLIGSLLVEGAARAATRLGLLARRLQSGRLHAYAFLLALGAILLVAFTAF